MLEGPVTGLQAGSDNARQPCLQPFRKRMSPTKTNELLDHEGRQPVSPKLAQFLSENFLDRKSNRDAEQNLSGISTI
jgi:hypothetical protein